MILDIPLNLIRNKMIKYDKGKELFIVAIHTLCLRTLTGYYNIYTYIYIYIYIYEWITKSLVKGETILNNKTARALSSGTCQA